MAVKNKTDLTADIAGLPNPITAVALKAVMTDMVDSYEDLIREFTTVQRNALTPFEGQKIYNTTSNRLEYYSTDMWLPFSQKESVEIDCSANPNYPEALVGDQYIVTVAGFIGGGSGKSVSAGDLVYCIVDDDGGTEAANGVNWKVNYSSVSGAQLKKATLTIASADVLNLFTVPKTLVAAVSGKAIQVVSGFLKATFNSSAYDCATGLQIGVSATTSQMKGDLEFIGNAFRPFIQSTFSDDSVLAVNTSLKVFTNGVVTLGDSDITVTVFYLEV